MNQPLMKWTGSKRYIAKEILQYFPESIDTYYEPFVGGGSVFFELLKSKKEVKHFRLSDKNESLIEIMNLVKDYPEHLILSYKQRWDMLQKDPDYFYVFRKFYNQSKSPLTFFFLTRTCYNGTIRYNQKGEFNTSLHFGRKGMNPNKIKEIIWFYHELMKGKDITFQVSSFEDIHPENKNDVIYLDPPYTNTKALYFGNINLVELQDWISGFNCSWFLNINGVNSSDNEETLSIPFDEKILLKSGKSSFSRMKGNDVKVQEYFYYKYAK